MNSITTFDLQVELLKNFHLNKQINILYRQVGSYSESLILKVKTGNGVSII
jgi:hypothetical protein